MFTKKVACYQFGDCQLDVANCQLVRSGSPVSLTQKSFELLEFLILNRGRILRKEEFLETLWEGNYVEEANLTQHIYMLRKALNQNRDGEIYIETIPKNGYRFVADVEEFASAAGIGVPVNRPKTNDGFSEAFREEIQLEPTQDRQAKFFDRSGGRKLLESDRLGRKRVSIPVAALFVLVFAFLAGSLFFYFAKHLRASTGTDIGSTSIAVYHLSKLANRKMRSLGLE